VNFISTTVQDGVAVLTNQGNFFIAISVGQVKVQEQTFTVISSQSPIGFKLKGLKRGDSIEFGGKKFTVLQLF
jgi:hypothetical protein